MVWFLAVFAVCGVATSVLARRRVRAAFDVQRSELRTLAAELDKQLADEAAARSHLLELLSATAVHDAHPAVNGADDARPVASSAPAPVPIILETSGRPAADRVFQGVLSEVWDYQSAKSVANRRRYPVAGLADSKVEAPMWRDVPTRYSLEFSEFLRVSMAWRLTDTQGAKLIGPTQVFKVHRGRSEAIQGTGWIGRPRVRKSGIGSLKDRLPASA